MPNFIVEYSDNIKDEADIPKLLKGICNVFISHPEEFPVGGIKTRAIEVHDYRIGDGSEDDALVHGYVQVKPGRTEETKEMICEELFTVMREHFANLYVKRGLSLSLELREVYTYRQNNIIERYEKKKE